MAKSESVSVTDIEAGKSEIISDFQRPGPARSPDTLLAILDAGPIDPAAMAFMSQARRKKALDGIDALIAALDALDPDPDIEPTMAGGNGQGQLDECEPDVDDEWSGDEHEPSLGSLGGTIEVQWFDQRLWSASSTSEREEENEHGCDLGGADNGIADMDGVADQRGHDLAGYSIA